MKLTTNDAGERRVIAASLQELNNPRSHRIQVEEHAVIEIEEDASILGFCEPRAARKDQHGCNRTR